MRKREAVSNAILILAIIIALLMMPRHEPPPPLSSQEDLDLMVDQIGYLSTFDRTSVLLNDSNNTIFWMMIDIFTNQTRENITRMAESARNSSKLLYINGLGHAFFGEYNESIESYDKSIGNETLGPWAWEAKGNALFHIGRYNESEASYEEAIKLVDNQAYMESFVNSTFFKELREKPSSTEIALIYMDFNDTEDADAFIASYRNYISSVTRKFVGLIFFRNKDYARALENFEKVLEANPENFQAHFFRGKTLGALGREAEALQAFRNSTQIYPYWSESWYARGYAANNLRLYREALQAFDNATNLEPSLWDAWCQKGLVIVKAYPNYDRAKFALERCDQAYPNDNVTWYFMAYSARYHGKENASVDAYNKLLQIQPDNELGLKELCSYLVKLERFEEAATLCNRTVQLYGDDAKYWYNNGYALFMLKRYNESAYSFNRVLTINPKDTEAMKKLGYSLWRLGECNQSIETYMRVFDVKPGDPDTIDEVNFIKRACSLD